MIVLAGGDLVLPDRIVTAGALIVDGQRIAAIEANPKADPAGATHVDVSGCYVVPGFVDVHVHGVDGIDSLDGRDAVLQIAHRLPGYGVTAFCPTTVACSPRDLAWVLAQVRHCRVDPVPGAARVLPAHLESNFINPDYRGAQPAACLRLPTAAVEGDFSGSDILDVIHSAHADVGIVTLAPELPGGLSLVRALVSAGHRVSLGHSAATFEQGMEAIDAGARHATHLFNRMPPLSHRSPGLAGAVLARAEIAAELICDGHHVHPAMARAAIKAKGVAGVMAITDGTAGSGLAPGSLSRLGGREIRVGDRAATLADGTLAGSTLTMDRAFRTIVSSFGLSIAEAAMLCATTPARELGLTGFGVIADGMVADLAVLDRSFQVVRTFVGGVEVYRRGATA